MSRRLRPLVGTEVDHLPAMCRGCVFWELAGACPAPRSEDLLPGCGDPPGPDTALEAGARKLTWISAQVDAGTPPGRVVELDGEVVAYALFAPAAGFARRGVTVPATDRDALLFATAWVHPVHRGVGLGRLLLQAALKEAIRLDLPVVEAYGDRRWHDRSCVLPSTWLLHEGFEVHREHPRTPLLRVDTKRTARWAESFEQAVEEVLGRLPVRAPRRVLVPEGARVVQR